MPDRLHIKQILTEQYKLACSKLNILFLYISISTSLLFVCFKYGRIQANRNSIFTEQLHGRMKALEASAHTNKFSFPLYLLQAYMYKSQKCKRECEM